MATPVAPVLHENANAPGLPYDDYVSAALCCSLVSGEETLKPFAALIGARWVTFDNKNMRLVWGVDGNTQRYIDLTPRVTIQLGHLAPSAEEEEKESSPAVSDTGTQ